MLIKIEYIVLIVLIRQIKQIYYLSIHIKEIDDCLSIIKNNNDKIFYSYECTDSDNHNYPKDPIEFEYKFGEIIYFEIYDKIKEAYIGIEIRINEFKLIKKLQQFLVCTNCDTTDGNYIYKSKEERFDLKKHSSSSKTYKLNFSINSEEELIYSNDIIDKKYYIFNKNENNLINSINFNKELILIDFKIKKNFHIDHNKTLIVPFDTIYFQLYFDKNILNTGKIMGYNFKTQRYEELHNNDTFQINDQYSTLNYIFSENDKNNRRAHIKINIRTYNSPKDLSLSQIVSNLGIFEYIIESDGNINCTYYHYNISNEEKYIYGNYEYY